MENSTNLNTQKTNETNGSTNTQPGENGKQSEKLFSQEEVNKIVSDRLKEERERTKAEPNKQDAREIELSNRENRLKCKEYLIEKGYNAELIDILDTTNFEKFSAAAEKISEIYHGTNNSVEFKGLKPGQGEKPLHDNDFLIADAFKPKI